MDNKFGNISELVPNQKFVLLHYENVSRLQVWVVKNDTELYSYLHDVVKSKNIKFATIVETYKLSIDDFGEKVYTFHNFTEQELNDIDMIVKKALVEKTIDYLEIKKNAMEKKLIKLKSQYQ